MPDTNIVLSIYIYICSMYPISIKDSRAISHRALHWEYIMAQFEVRCHCPHVY